MGNLEKTLQFSPFTVRFPCAQSYLHLVVLKSSGAVPRQ